MSFLSALFGRLTPASAEKVPEPVEYKGFVIRAAPYKSEGHKLNALSIECERIARKVAAAASTLFGIVMWE